ncbi:hypothetical protein [Streptomyces sp. KAU_LT]|uniref:hypothetical protein n=1 Tax=Streptomyces sp. KAU_LT TaxID=3046669 RepID=UPI0024B788E7|nr:hypothetical protein [Streptomyces sp. KAU_LT]MDI9836069.1 hypothetical protein [Streptomyces sp. KAU_LT]
MTALPTIGVPLPDENAVTGASSVDKEADSAIAEPAAASAEDGKGGLLRSALPFAPVTVAVGTYFADQVEAFGPWAGGAHAGAMYAATGQILFLGSRYVARKVNLDFGVDFRLVFRLGKKSKQSEDQRRS